MEPPVYRRTALEVAADYDLPIMPAPPRATEAGPAPPGVVCVAAKVHGGRCTRTARVMVRGVRDVRPLCRRHAQEALRVGLLGVLTWGG